LLLFEKGMMRSCSGKLYILCDLYFLIMIIMVRKYKESFKATAKRYAKQVSLTPFIVPDPQDRRAARAPPCLR
jgi:hypothetical protein